MYNATLGEQRVRTSFNPEDNNVIDQIKQEHATMINKLQNYWTSIVNENEHLSREVFNKKYGELQRLISLSQTSCEEACMWAVKAITYTPKY